MSDEVENCRDRPVSRERGVGEGEEAWAVKGSLSAGLAVASVRVRRELADCLRNLPGRIDMSLGNEGGQQELLSERFECRRSANPKCLRCAQHHRAIDDVIQFLRIDARSANPVSSLRLAPASLRAKLLSEEA